jgi:Peptidase A4 family
MHLAIATFDNGGTKMANINLDNNVKIRTFSPPPSGFDPLTAAESELVNSGFPSRPTDPKLLERYRRFFTRVKGKFQYIVPTFRVDPTKSTRPQKGSSMGAGTESSDNWSGGVVYAPKGESFKWVQGDWVVPNVYAPTQNKWYYCANWIGIDGDGSGDVCQAGMICAVYQSGNSITRTIYPWHEWAPSGWVEITNLTITAGDLISMLICTAQGAGSTTASIFFGNQTSGVSMSYEITAPSGTKLVGNSAEWIVETPIVGGALTQMPDYGEVFFSNCEAALTNGTVINGGTGNSINLGQNGTTVSTGTLITPTIIECQYTG